MDKVLIIAEAGVNHNGSLDMAKQLIDVAASCGVDIVKFQTARLDSLVSKCAAMADYQKNNIGQEKTQKEMLAELLLPFEDFIILADYCKEKGVEFLSTPFDIDSINFLKDMVNVWKVPSGEITNYPYLREIGKTGKKVILSTGMSTMDEVEAAVKVLKQFGTKDIILLHCTTEYPAPYDQINLRAMNTMAEHFGLQVGYSDHTEGVEVSLAAVAMGAKVIEKHFTLDKTLPGPDHKASMSPEELKQLVVGIRKIEMALGDGEKRPTEAEEKNKSVVRKSIVAAKDIAKGDLLTEENLTTKRPGSGINPMRWDEVIGTITVRDFEEDEIIEIS
ncbi:MAG: N-acetylneuraminate synthase [Lachnospiraceae bacterium]|nr:N-acetylneuraminate synthase [Lachnospiraceae bacterium]